MSIPVYVEGNTVGKLSGWWECIIVEEEKNLFSKSLMGTTIQDDGTRERKGGWITKVSSFCAYVSKCLVY